MKKLTALIILFLITVNGNNIFSQIPGVMRDRPWLDQQPHIVFGHSVTMNFGEKYTALNYSNTGEITSIGYQSLSQTIDSLKNQAKRDKWSDKTLTDTIQHYKKDAPGGRLFIYLSRYDQTKANTKWYFIIIRDKNEKTLLEKELNYQAPQTPEGTGWYNYYEFLIGKDVKLPFYVYLNDRDSAHLSDYRFFISNP